MIKVAFITDLHFGIRGNSEIFLDNIQTYLTKEFIPYLLENKIEWIIIGGDILDNRQTINVKTLNYVINFFKFLQMNNFKVIVIAGNHDLYHSTSNELTSLSFLSNFSNITLIQNGYQRILIEDSSIVCISWISNAELFIQNDIQTLSKYAQSNICIGHFEFNDFRMSKNSKIQDMGMPHESVSNLFKYIISGHYHMRNMKILANGTHIIYAGSPYQLTRADAQEDRGFMVLTLDNNELTNFEFIDNKDCIKFESVKFPDPFTEAQIKNNIVDILVNYTEKFDEHKLDEYRKEIEKFNPAFKPEIKIITAQEEIDKSVIKFVKGQSILEVINSYLEEISIEKKDEVKSELIELYNAVKME